jgi:biopolymer transport protein ExbD
MKVWHLLTIAILLSNPCFAQRAPIQLYILQNGHVRFDGGPELDQSQLVTKLHELKQKNPRPEIRIIPDRGAKYYSVAVVLAAFQKADYGPHLGLVGNSN